MLLSAHEIREPVGVLGWISVLVGFLGELFLLKPGSGAFSAWAFLPLFGACSYALAHIITRTKCQCIPPAAPFLAQNLMVLAAGLTRSVAIAVVKIPRNLSENYPYILTTWSHIEAVDWAVLFRLATFAASLGMMLAAAYEAAPPATIAPFEYSYQIFVAGWDVLFFDIVLDVSTMLDSVLIVFSGLLVLQKRPSK